MPARLRNVRGYPSTALGVARRKARAAEQQLARYAAIAEARAGRAQAVPQFKRGYDRTAGYYGRFSGPAGELKFFDTALSFNIDTTAEVPATGQLALIPQGQTQSTRNGNKCTIRSINVHGVLRFVPGASGSADAVVYMYVIQDTQANGAAPSVGDANTGIFTSADLSLANMNLVNAGRFRILKKWVIPFNVGAGVTTAYNNMSRPFTFYKKCSIPMLYDASADTGALTTIRTNNVFMVAGCVSQDDTISCAGTCRLRYSDSS